MVQTMPLSPWRTMNFIAREVASGDRNFIWHHKPQLELCIDHVARRSDATVGSKL